MSRILQLVPYLPPRISGVGDFAITLSTKLQSHHGLDSTLLVAHPETGTRPANGQTTLELPSREPAEVARAIAAETPSSVLLHYSGYGYQTRGVPLWLLATLRHLRAGHPRIRVVVYFHELRASGKPWQSSFWLSPLQSHIAKELVRLADAAITTSALAQRWLRERAPEPKPVLFRPVFSNVGEPVKVPAFPERRRAAVVWGSPEQKARIYAAPDALLAFLKTRGIETLDDIGAAGEVPPRIREAVRVETRGVLPGSEIGALLADSRFGLMNYRPDIVTKSGIHAALCAHGATPVNTWTGPERAEDTVPLWGLPDAPAGGATEVCRTWYAGHSSEILAGEVARLLTR